MATNTVSGILLDERVYYSVTDICEVCGTRDEWVVALVEHGVLRPQGDAKQQWKFPGSNLHLAMRARRLEQDLDLNLPGVALALELLQEIDSLRTKLEMLEGQNAS